MALWDLLTVSSGAAALGGAIAAAKVARKIGNTHFLIALAVGLLVAAVCTWIVRAVGRKMFERLLSATRVKQHEKLTLRAIYALTFGWVIVSPFWGYQITKLFIRALENPTL